MRSTAAQKSKNPGWTGTVFALLLALLLAFVANPGHAAGEVTVTYIHTDISGNPLAATGENGNLLWKENYQAFGARQQNSPASAQQTQWFHGKEQDATTGLQYFGARWYDPETGRFLGVDPLDFQDGNLHSFNRYAYGNNNPLRYVDPDGNNATTAFGGLLTEGYNFATGQGFNGGMVWGALLDGYNGEGAGIFWSAAEDALNLISAGYAVKALRTTKTAGASIQAEIAASNASKAALQEINITARISASGMNNPQAGVFFGWGKSGKITKNISSFSKDLLEANGWTREITKSVAQGYREIARVTPQNKSALPRANQLESLLKLWD